MKEPIDTEQQVLTIDVNYSILTEDDVHSPIDMVIDQGSSTVVTLDDYKPSDQVKVLIVVEKANAVKENTRIQEYKNTRIQEYFPNIFLYYICNFQILHNPIIWRLE